MKVLIGIALTLIIQSSIVIFSERFYLTWDEDEKSIQFNRHIVAVEHAKEVKNAQK